MKPGKSKHTKKPFKVILLGEAGVGKTSLLNRYSNGKFSSQTTTTVGVDRVPFTIHISDEISNDRKGNNETDFEVIDTAGCYAFHSLIQSYVRNVDAVVFVYDITDKESFACLPLWNGIINRTCEEKLPLKLLVGNKKDLESEREVQTKNAKNYAEFEGMFTAEVSVKDQIGLDIFQWLTNRLQQQTTKQSTTLAHLPSKKNEEHCSTETNEGHSDAKLRMSPSLLQQADKGVKERGGSIRKKLNFLLPFGMRKKDCVKGNSHDPKTDQQNKCFVTQTNNHSYVINDYVVSLINY